MGRCEGGKRCAAREADTVGAWRYVREVKSYDDYERVKVVDVMGRKCEGDKRCAGRETVRVGAEVVRGT